VTDDVWAIIHPCRRLCARGRALACMHAELPLERDGDGATILIQKDLNMELQEGEIPL